MPQIAPRPEGPETWETGSRRGNRRLALIVAGVVLVLGPCVLAPFWLPLWAAYRLAQEQREPTPLVFRPNPAPAFAPPPGAAAAPVHVRLWWQGDTLLAEATNTGREPFPHLTFELDYNAADGLHTQADAIGRHLGPMQPGERRQFMPQVASWAQVRQLRFYVIPEGGTFRERLPLRYTFTVEGH